MATNYELLSTVNRQLATGICLLATVYCLLATVFCLPQTCAIGILTILNILVALHLSRELYKSTLFMQNKPNFRKSQMNVSIFSQIAYENKFNWTLGENKPNSNPIQSQSNPTCSELAEPISRQNKPNQTSQKSRISPKFQLLKLIFGCIFFLCLRLSICPAFQTSLINSQLVYCIGYCESY